MAVHVTAVLHMLLTPYQCTAAYDGRLISDEMEAAMQTALLAAKPSLLQAHFVENPAFLLATCVISGQQSSLGVLHCLAPVLHTDAKHSSRH